MVTFPLLSLACVEGAAERVGEGAEGGLVEDALEAVVGVARPLVVASLAGLAQHWGEAGGGGEGCGGQAMASSAISRTRRAVAPRMRAMVLGRAARIWAAVT